MMSMSYLALSLTSSCATVSSKVVDSMTQGPAMTTGFCMINCLRLKLCKVTKFYLKDQIYGLNNHIII